VKPQNRTGTGFVASGVRKFPPGSFLRHIMKQEAVRATVDIPISLYRRLKEQAAAQGRSVPELILVGARSTLVEGKRPRPKRVRFPLIVSKGPKVDLTNEHIYYECVEFTRCECSQAACLQFNPVA